MKITKLLKILSSETKLKLIVHFLYCECNKSTVNDIVLKFSCKQANISKHLMDLKRNKILIFSREGKQIFYQINHEFLKKYKSLVDEIIKYNDFDKYKCYCNCNK